MTGGRLPETRLSAATNRDSLCPADQRTVDENRRDTKRSENEKHDPALLNPSTRNSVSDGPPKSLLR